MQIITDPSLTRRSPVILVVMLITNLRHYLDEDGNLPDLPAPALDLAFHLGAIVGWVSRCPSESLTLTNVRCHQRSKRRRCLGEILARLDRTTGAIEWTCPLCDDSGMITGWEGSPWDRSVSS